MKFAALSLILMILVINSSISMAGKKKPYSITVPKLIDFLCI